MELVFLIKNMNKVMIKVVTSLAYAKDMKRLIIHFGCFQQMLFYKKKNLGTLNKLELAKLSYA